MVADCVPFRTPARIPRENDRNTLKTRQPRIDAGSAPGPSASMKAAAQKLFATPTLTEFSDMRLVSEVPGIAPCCETQGPLRELRKAW